PVAFEVEDGRAGDRGAQIVVWHLPYDVDLLAGEIRLEHRIEGRHGDADLRRAVAVEVGDRGRTAGPGARELRRAEHDRAGRAVEDPYVPCAHDGDIGLAILVEVAHAWETIADIGCPQHAAVGLVGGLAGEELEVVVGRAVQIDERGERLVNR